MLEAGLDDFGDFGEVLPDDDCLEAMQREKE
jgi:hypothetical protein